MHDLLTGILCILVVLLLSYIIHAMFPTIDSQYVLLILMGFLLASWLTGKFINSLE